LEVAPAPALLPGGALEGVEKQAILAILRQTQGHRQRAADILGISRRTLSRKLKQYGQPEDNGWSVAGAGSRTA
jgi:DNA-binding NtrC family response regulator